LPECYRRVFAAAVQAIPSRSAMEATSESVLSPLDPFPQLTAMRMLPERLL